MKQNNRSVIKSQHAEIFVGIDIAKKIHVASIIDKNEATIKRGFSVENHVEGFRNLKKYLDAWPKSKILIGLESTGIYWKSLFEYLTRESFEVVLINPHHTKLSKDLFDNDRSKNDKKDSLLIAKLLRQGHFLKHVYHVNEYADLNKMIIFREQVLKRSTQYKICMKTLLSEFLPEYEHLFSRINGTASLALLSSYGLDGLKNNFNSEEKIALIRKKSLWQISDLKAKYIVKTLSSSIGVTEGVRAAERNLVFMITQLQALQSQLNDIENEIVELLDKMPETKYLLSIKGINYITIATILGQTGTFNNYTNPHQIQKLAGMQLAENSSGEFKGRSTMSKRGKRQLRCALHRAAVSVANNCNAFRQLYAYKINTMKKPAKIAFTAIAIKLLRVMFSLVKNECEYNDDIVLNSIKI